MNRVNNQALLALVTASIFAVSLFQPLSLAEDSDYSYPANIFVDLENGNVITESSIISVTIQNEELPTYATWELLDTSGTRFFIDFTEDLEIYSESNFSESVASWKEWSFGIEVNPAAIGHCSCIAKITVQEETGNTVSLIRTLFISPDSPTNYQFPPIIHVISDSESQWSRKTHILQFVTMDIDLENPNLSYIIADSTNVKCSNVYIGVPDESIDFIPSANTATDGLFSYEIMTENLTDGWYDLSVFAINPTNQQFSHDCMSIMVDNSPPVVIIEGQNNVAEGSGYTIFDGSSSFDETWGIQGLTYVWSVVNTDSSIDNDTVILAGLDERTLSVSTEDAGTYEIKLTISDKAGNLATSVNYLEVQNIPPLVKLTIDGEPIENNGQFTLLREGSCIIDASGSTDTQNDADNLRYVWRVNNIPTYEGEARDFSWPEGVDGDFILTIEVIDDDSESSQISVLVKDGSTDSVLPLSIIVLILSVIFFSYSVVNMRKQTNESDIPKWS